MLSLTLWLCMDRGCAWSTSRLVRTVPYVPVYENREHRRERHPILSFDTLITCGCWRDLQLGAGDPHITGYQTAAAVYESLRRRRRRRRALPGVPQVSWPARHSQRRSQGARGPGPQSDAGSLRWQGQRALRVAAAGARAICGYRHAAEGRRGAPHAAPRSHRPRSQWRHTCAGAGAGACGTRVRALHARAAHARCGTAHVPLWRNISRTHGDAWHMLYARHTLHGRAVAVLPR